MGMSRKRTQLLAYFAGLFDGEGSIGIYKRASVGRGGRSVWKIVVSVAMTDAVAVAMLKREYPEGLFYQRTSKNPKHRAPYVFELYDGHAARFLKDIEPFSLVKWEQIKVGRSFLAHKEKAGYLYRNLRNDQGLLQPWPDEFHRRCERLADKMKALKTRGVNTVNARHKMREYRAKREDVEADRSAIQQLLEGVETRHSESVEAISAPEADIVHSNS